MLKFDFWYGDTLKDVDGVHVVFYPNEGLYRGNVCKAGRIIGDFTSSDSLEIEKYFPGIFEN